MFVSDTVRKKKLLSLSFTYTLILLIWENKEMSMMQHCDGIGGKLLSEMSIENQYEYLMHLSLSRLCKAPVGTKKLHFLLNFSTSSIMNIFIISILITIGHDELHAIIIYFKIIIIYVIGYASSFVYLNMNMAAESFLFCFFATYHYYTYIF